MRIVAAVCILYEAGNKVWNQYSLTFDFCGSTNEEGFLAAVEAGATTTAASAVSPGFFFAIVKLCYTDVRRVRASANVRLMNLFSFQKIHHPFPWEAPYVRREARGSLLAPRGTRLTLKIETMNQKFYIVSLFYGDTFIHCQQKQDVPDCSV